MREFQPIPDPSGALQPPDRWPPTAVGAETPMPEPEPSRQGASLSRSHRMRRAVLRVLVAIPAGIVGGGMQRVRRVLRKRRSGVGR
jgi:hypothetical protein